MNTQMINKLIGKICVVELENGKMFSAKLAQIDNDELWFVNSSGAFIMDRRSTIVRMHEIKPRVVT